MDAWTNYVSQAGPPLFGGYGGPSASAGTDFNVPGLPPLLGLGGQLLVNQVFQGSGMLPGPFLPSQNLIDHYQAKAFWAARQQALAFGAQADIPAMVATQRGLLQTLGVPFGLQQQSFAQARAQDMAQLLPILGQVAPHLVDAMMGSRGSATVLAAGIHDGGRLATDPVTGRYGLSGDSAGQLAQAIYQQNFAPGQSLAGWRGISAGQAGQLYGELTRRGLMGPSIAHAGRANQVGVLTQGVDDLAGLLNEAAETSPAAFATLVDRVERHQRRAFRDVRQAEGDEQLDILSSSAGVRGGLGARDAASARQALRTLRDSDRTRYDQLVEQQFQEELRGRRVTERLDAAGQVEELSGTQQSAEAGLLSLKRLDPKAYQRLVRQHELANPTRPVQGLREADQVHELARNQQLAYDALHTVQQTSASEFQRLTEQHDRLRPGGSIRALSQDDQVYHLAQTEGITEAAIREIQKADPTRFESLLRQFDASRVANRMKTLSGAVSAMRDIFGDAGRPNAPMTELIEGLQQLTQGGLATMAPAELEQTLRLTQSLAKQTGMGIQNMQGLTAQAAGAADMLGLDRTFALQATQGAAAFGAAFNEVGRGDLAAWGRKSIEQVTMTDQALRLRAAGSPLANQLAATVRTVQELGLPETSDAGRLAAAVQAGQTEFTDSQGNTRSVHMEASQWMDLMAGSGMSRGAAASVLNDKYSNQEYTARYKVGDTVRQMQAKLDVQPLIGQGYESAILGGLIASGMSQEDALKTARAAQRGVAASVLDLDAETRRDASKRNTAVSGAIREQLQAQGIDVDALEAANPNLLREMSVVGYGNVEERIRKDARFQYLESFQNTLDLTDQQTQARQQAQLQQAETTGRMRSAMAGLGGAGPLRRVIDSLQSGAPPADAQELLGTLLGGVKVDEVMARLNSPEAATTMDEKERLAAVMGTITDQIQQFQSGGGQVTDSQLRKRVLDLSEAERNRLLKAHKLEPGEDVVETLLADGGARLEISDQIRQAQQTGLVSNVEALKQGGTAALDRARALLTAEGVAGEELEQILTGKQAAPEELNPVVQALRAAARGDTTAALADQGIVVDAKVSNKDTLDVAIQGEKLDRLLRRGPIAKETADGAMTEEYLQASRHAGALLKRSASLTDVLLGDTKSMQALGKGGLDLVTGLREKRRSLDRLAVEKGSTAEELLLQGDEDALKLSQGITADLQTIAKRQAGPVAADQAMTDEETERLKALQAKETQTPEAQLNELLESSSLGADLSEADRKQLYATVDAAGPNAIPELRRAVEARDKITQLMKDNDITDLRELRHRSSAWLGDEKLSRSERKEAKQLMQTAGALMRIGEHDEGTGISAVEGAVQDLLRTRVGGETKAKEMTGEGGTQRITGTLTIKRDGTGELSAQSTASGSTPVFSG